MKIIIGLGNPGNNYKKTYHNVGSQAVKKLALTLGFLNQEKFNYQKKFEAEIATGIFNQEKVVLVRPQIWRNESGIVVKKIIDFYQLNPKDLWIIYDDIDLPLGKIRIKPCGSAGGHKGIESIIQYLKLDDFYKFKIGIGPQGKLPAEKYVLQRISKIKQLKHNRAQKNMVEAVIYCLENGIENTMNKFN